jgi:hypothetical protein
MNLPNFIILGAGKSGTTTINYLINQHHDVFMSPVKEPNFFALEGETKITGYDSEDPHGFYHYPQSITNLKDYKLLFKDVKNEKIIGDCSNMYQYKTKAADNIKKYVPETKLLGVFRNPSERLFSRHQHLLRQNLSPTLDFTDCFTEGNLWWQKNDLIQEGFYYSHMKYYFDNFDHSKIKIMLYDDFRDNPTTFMKEVFDFLEIDNDFTPDYSMKLNVGGEIKNKFQDKFIGEQSVIRKSIEKFFPSFVNWCRQNKTLLKFVYKLRNKNLKRVYLSPEIKKRLNDEIYGDEILKFSKLIGRDLSHWLE